MKNVLDEIMDLGLYNLNENADKSVEYKTALNELLRCETELLKAYPECKSLFDEYQMADIDLHKVINRNEFHRGFRIGAQLVLEMIKPIV